MRSTPRCTAPVGRRHGCSRPPRRLLHAEVERARRHCAALVRTHDAPSHVLQPFVPRAARDAYLAVRALHVDVARVADTTSEPAVGRMRMQLWRDAVGHALAGTPPHEPVAVLLASAAHDLHERSGGQARLSKQWLLRLISARERQLGNPPFPSLRALERYAEHTHATMLYLTLAALPQASLTTDHIASHIGKAMGIAAVLRRLPLLAFPPRPGAHGAVLLPLDVMADANVREEDVFRHAASAPGLRDAVFTVATRANDHLITARDMLSRLRSEGSLGHAFEHQHEEEHQYTMQQLSAGKDAQLADVEHAFGVFMPSISTQSWLDRLQKADFDVFDASLRTVDWKLPLKAYWAYSRRKI